jgi:hypothetical protein
VNVSPAGAQLVHGRFRRLPLGAIHPRGWLLEQLELQARWATGPLDELWAEVGPTSAWLGGSGEDRERGPFYLDGLVPLAHLLVDAKLLEKSNRWIDSLLFSQRDDGQFGPRSNVDWWPRMVALKALAQHFEATSDERILPFMERYFAHQLRELPRRPLEKWAAARSAENLLVFAWFLERRAAPDLLPLVDLLVEQGLDWGGKFADEPPRGVTRDWSPYRHIVNVAMGLKLPAVRFLLDDDQEQLETLRRALANLDRLHGQVTGMFSGDEWLAGRSPARGTELCAVVEFMFTLETLFAIVGDSTYGDRLEQVAYNALPATFTPDMRAHQYLQQANQIACTVAPRSWTYSSDEANVFGFAPHYGCCTANLHQAWPKLTSSLWMTTDDSALVAVAYAPCRVETKKCALEVETKYPFSDEIAIRVAVSSPAAFEIRLRIPSWCDSPALRLSGESVDLKVDEGFARLHREWRDGDLIELMLPSKPRFVQRSKHSVGVALGPLVLALPIGEDWRALPDRAGLGDWEVHPTTAWNFGLAIDESVRVSRSPDIPSPPFGSPWLRVEVNARRVGNWRARKNSADAIPTNPTSSDSPTETVELVPYAAARLRIAEFPRIHDIQRDAALSMKDPEFLGGSDAGLRPGGRRCSSDAKTEEVLR